MKPVYYFALHITLCVQVYCTTSSLATSGDITTNNPKDGICPDGFDGGLVPHPYDCHLFYGCYFHLSYPVLYSCPDGLYFVEVRNSTKHLKTEIKIMRYVCQV